jgi:hypothetical protein|nr:MAG TPA: hypothetical protein [Ackermannviridae sp.]
MKNQLHRAEIDLTLDLHSLRCDPELRLVLGEYPRDYYHVLFVQKFVDLIRFYYKDSTVTLPNNIEIDFSSEKYRQDDALVSYFSNNQSLKYTLKVVLVGKKSLTEVVNKLFQFDSLNAELIRLPVFYYSYYEAVGKYREVVVDLNDANNNAIITGDFKFVNNGQHLHTYDYHNSTPRAFKSDHNGITLHNYDVYYHSIPLTFKNFNKTFFGDDGDDYIVWEDESELPKLLQKYPLFNSCYPPLSKSGEKWGELKARYTYEHIQEHNQSLEYNNSPLTLDDDVESEISVQSVNNRTTTNNSSNNCRIISDIERQELPRKMAQAGYSERTINAFVELVDEYCGYKGDLNDLVVKNIEQHISDTLSKILAG